MNIRPANVTIVLMSLVLAGGALLLPSPAVTAPQAYEVSEEWQLDVELGQPRAIYVSVPGQDRPVLYWFLPFTVTNRTGEDQLFVPEISLYTNTGQLLRAGAGVNPAAFQKIKKIYNNPLLQDVMGLTGKILQGADNAKDGVAIFSNFDPEATSFTIFFGGLSGDTVTIKLPSPVKVQVVKPDGTTQTVTRDRVTLAKTLQLQYSLAVGPNSRGNAKPQLLRRDWIMR
jgi:hypothetical protein